MVYAKQRCRSDLLFFRFFEERLPCCVSVCAIRADWRRPWAFFTHQAGVQFGDDSRNPCVASGIRNDRDLEFELRVEALGRGVAVCVDEIRDIGNREIIFSEEPLVDFDLALVSVLPVGVKRDIAVFARRFVVDDVEGSVSVDPNIVDSSANDEIRVWIMILDAIAQRVSPKIEVRV